MADLKPLIRYRKHGVDERRRVLAKLYRESENLQRTKRQAEDDIINETKIAHEIATAQILSDLGRFTELTKVKIKALAEAIKNMDVRIAAAQEDMRNAFSEMKKVEITQRNRAAREDKAKKKKEDKELDEMALEIHRRQKEEEDQT